MVFWIAVAIVNAVQPPHVSSPLPAAVTSASLEPAALQPFFNDNAQLFQSGDQQRFENQLAAFEKETSSQIAVAVYRRAPAMPVEDFTIRTATQSHLGQAHRDNGATLFLFVEPKIARIEVGYGLEGPLTDARVRQILDTKLAPAVRSGDYEAAIDGTLTAILSTVHDEYRNAHVVTFGDYVKIAWKKSKLALSKAVRGAWSATRSTPPNLQVVITILGTLVGFGLSGTLVSSAHLIRAAVRRKGFDQIDYEPIWDTVKLALFLVALAGGGILMAGGGTFGGAGGQVHW